MRTLRIQVGTPAFPPPSGSRPGAVRKAWRRRADGSLFRVRFIPWSLRSSGKNACPLLPGPCEPTGEFP
jgi:hypothetical protein